MFIILSPSAAAAACFLVNMLYLFNKYIFQCLSRLERHKSAPLHIHIYIAPSHLHHIISINPQHTKHTVHHICLYWNSKHGHSKEPKHPKPTIPRHLAVHKINHRVANPHQTKIPVMRRPMMRPVLIQRNHEPNNSHRLNTLVMHRMPLNDSMPPKRHAVLEEAE
eukprot:191150_1